MFTCFICTLCWRRRKGSSISMPPSWTIHHTSMWPSVKRSPFDGKAEMFFGTRSARWAVVVSLTNSAEQTRAESDRICLHVLLCLIFLATLNKSWKTDLHENVTSCGSNWDTISFWKGFSPFDVWVLVDILTYHVRNVQSLRALKMRINRITEYIL